MKKGENEYAEITNIDLELDEMTDEVNYCSANKSAWYDFSGLFAPNVLLRTSIGVIIKFLQQLTGINSIFYYSSIIFQGKLTHTHTELHPFPSSSFDIERYYRRYFFSQFVPFINSSTSSP